MCRCLMASLVFCTSVCRTALATEQTAPDPLDERRVDEDEHLAYEDPAEESVAEEPHLAPWQHFDSRRVQLEARLGFGTLVGGAGLVGDVNAFDGLAVGAGVGLNPWGFAWGAAVRVRPVVFRSSRLLHALTVEAGYSNAKYADDDDSGPIWGVLDGGRDDEQQPGVSGADYVPETAHWIQGEAGWEGRLRSGLMFRGTLGVAWLAAPISWRCTSLGSAASCDEPAPSSSTGVLTLAVGQAF